MRRWVEAVMISLVVMLSVAALPSPATAQSETSGRTAPERTEEGASFRLDEADALVILEERNLTLDTDGRVTDGTLIRKKILTYEGMDSEGDPHLAFNNTHQVLEIKTSRTTTPEGKVLDTQANGFNLITPFPLAKAPFFTDGRQMVVTHVGLDLGAVTELHYTVKDTGPWRPFLFGEEPLAGHRPIREKVLRVSVPEGVELTSQVLGGEALHTEEARDGLVAHTWKVTEVPLFHTEAATSAELSFLPRVVYSTAKSWEEAAGAFFTKARQAKVVDEALVAKAGEIVSGEESDWRKLAKLHAFVHDRIQNVDWPSENCPEAPRNASEIYRSRYGLPIEKTVLLAGFLDALELKSDLLFVSRGPVIATGVPSMSQFPIPVLEVQVEDRTLWVDPGRGLEGDAERDYLGRSAIRWRDGKAEIFTVDAASGTKNSEEIRGQLALDEKRSWTGEITVELAGVYSPHTKLLLTGKTPDDCTRDIVKSVLTGFSVDSCTVVELSPLKSIVSARVSRQPDEKDTLVVLTLGNPEGSLAAGLEGLFRQSRDLPLLLSHPGSEILRLEVTLPEEMGTIVLPPEGEEACGASRAYRKVSSENGKISIERGLEIGETLVTPEDYPSLRKIFGFVRDRNSNSLFVIR
jgi:hypothetical protein